MSLFDSCFSFTIGVEDGYTNNPEDPGNWTGGAIGHGNVAGTKYGISAAAYPNIDISALTLDDAKSIYQQDQWAKIDGDSLAPEIALVLFDSVVNSGIKWAVTWVQDALSITADGIFGSETRAALSTADSSSVAKEVLARRINFLAQLPSWTEFGLGWSRRVASLAFAAAQIS